ncbi:hypothetical protein SDC9_128520 [bioreactor metagenome]|uniref:Uncharacterized protein n=1 Tax=bioreactor metagenome TaxID=1076179 RepID=A0A645CX24_9ZZZZ
MLENQNVNVILGPVIFAILKIFGVGHHCIFAEMIGHEGYGIIE